MHCGNRWWILSKGWWRVGLRMAMDMGMSWEWVAADHDLLVWSLSPRNNEIHQFESSDHVEEFSVEKDTISNRIWPCFSPSISCSISEVLARSSCEHFRPVPKSFCHRFWFVMCAPWPRVIWFQLLLFSHFIARFSGSVLFGGSACPSFLLRFMFCVD